MGMYSSFIKSNGLKIKNRKAIKETETTDGMFDNDSVDFGMWCGYKIQGYWYDDTRDALDMICKVIDATENPEDNYAEFMYEEGYRFRICFIKENGKVVWRVQFEKEPEFDDPEVI